MSAAALDGVSWVRLGFIDVFGTSNSVQIPASRYAIALDRGVPFDGSALEGAARYLESDMLLRPDPTTLVRLDDGTARVICNVQTPDGEPWNADPRCALETVAHDAGELEGLTVSAELEFYLLDEASAPVDRAGYFDEIEGVGGDVVRTVGDRLLAGAVPVEGSHHEAGSGQYELDVGPLPLLALADAIVSTKQLVRDEAHARGLRATFMPRPFSGVPGSGLHLHQRSALLCGEDGELQETGRHYLAGQLAHAAALCALAAPTVNSYKRLHAGPEAPGAVVWAHMNRGALLRVSSYRGEEASLEYRGADPSANPYLLLAGLVAAGLDGLEHELELPNPVEEVVLGYDPARSEQRPEPLPRTLDEALDALLADDVLLDAFDGALIDHLVRGRRAEAEAYRGLVTDWERDKLLDHA